MNDNECKVVDYCANISLLNSHEKRAFLYFVCDTYKKEFKINNLMSMLINFT